MDIHELESYNLADAVKFNDRLNPKIWGPDEQLRPEVRDKLLAAADDFRENLGVADLDLEDITVSGSNAAYTYTPHSDIDLHLVVRQPDDAVYRELFDAKKYQYNDEHDIRIGPYQVEFYVQDAAQPHVSQGIYSVLNNKWISVPRRRRADIDDMSVQHKFEQMGHRIERAIKSQDLDEINDTIDRLKNMRKVGLATTGEFGAENLAFKILRTQGLIQKLYDARNKSKDRLLSLDERKKKKRGQKFAYGSFGGWFYPGYSFDSGSTGDAGGGDGGGGESMREDNTGMTQGSEIGDAGAQSTWDGVSKSTQTFLSEDPKTGILRDFVNRTVQRLALKDPPRVVFHKNAVWAEQNRSFGQYDPDSNRLHVSLPGRHVMDIMRTIAHELTHAKQNERYALPGTAGETGSSWENSANAMAGIIMRDMARTQPDLFETIGADTDLTEGWLNRAAAATALSAAMSMMPAQAQDQEQPQQGATWGQVLNTALKLYGISQIRKPQVRAEVEQEFKNYLRARQGDANAQNQSEIYQWEKQQQESAMGEDYDPDHPPGPESKPTMPKGTIRVDVSDMYDWYKLGQHISDLEGLGRHDFGKGPPSSILAFGDEDLEHEYIQNLKRTGLDVTDIDPGEHQPMKGQKTDPTYNVKEGASGHIATEQTRVGQEFKEDRTANIVFDTGEKRRVRYLPTTKDIVHTIIKYYLKQGLKVVKVDDEEIIWKRSPDSVAEASGYIPTKKQARDPRFSTALTVDIKPGEVGRQANKLNLKTDSQGRPGLLAKNLANALREFKETGAISERCWTGYRKQGMKKKGNRMVPNCVPVSEDEELTEVKMSPAEFQKFLKSPAAEGIRAGFEAELIFRDTQSDVDGGEAEPNYDADERAYDIDDIINFFTSGEYPIGGQSARRLQSDLQESFSDWAQQQFADDYFDLARFQEWADDNIWPDVDDQYRDQARDNLDGDDATDEQIESEAVSLFRDDVERDWDRSGDWYDQAREELFDEYYGDLDQSDWLDSAGLRWMSNVAEEYGLDWPYWTDGSGSGGTRDWQEIANGLERVTGMPVRVSSGYHGAARRPGQYIIEPDSSLDSDDTDDYGLEVVSPPLPLPEAIEQLNRIIDWANGPGDAYTNSSTGLHMGVSLPFKGGDVDPVKLILFMGDKNLLEMFGRESNTYARSAYERLESKIRGLKNAGPKQISGIMDLMKNNLIELADRELNKGGLLGDKYVSVHPQDGYIEFRGPGGDYLAKSDEIDGVLENTMLRLAYAMSIAGDNAAYRNEYAKKLYKMLTGYRGAEISKGPRDTKYQTKIETEGENPFMRLFADYSAGMLSGEELKAKWADTVLAAERGDVEDDDVEDVPMGTPQEYEVYDRATGEVYKTFQAYNDDEAVEQFSRHHRAPYARTGLPVLRVKASGRKSKEPTSRRAELAKRVTRSTRDVGEQLWRVNHHSSQRWVTARSQAEAVAKAIQQDRMFDNPETRARIATDAERQQWQYDQERERERQRDREQDAAEIRARLGAPQPAGGEPTGEWSVRDREGFLVTTLRPPEAMQSQDGAERYAQNWIARSRPDLDASDITVTPLTVEREPIPGSTLDIQRQRQQGEFTGAWEIRDAQGRELHRFGGVGNSQADANRFAASWLGRNRPDLAGQEVDVVPVMR